MNAPSSPNGDNGCRDSNGRFALGNPGGPGNPFSKRVAQLHRAFLDSVSEDDLRQITQKMVEQAKAGDLACAREIFTRLLGRPHDGIDLDQVREQDDAQNSAKRQDLILRMGEALKQLPEEHRKIVLQFQRECFWPRRAGESTSRSPS